MCKGTNKFLCIHSNQETADCRSSPPSPGSMCKGTNKFLCIHSNQETADCCGENGCCYSKQKVCCFISASACPPGGGPNDGVPACALCGKTCGGESAPEEE